MSVASTSKWIQGYGVHVGVCVNRGQHIMIGVQQLLRYTGLIALNLEISSDSFQNFKTNENVQTSYIKGTLNSDIEFLILPGETYQRSSLRSKSRCNIINMNEVLREDGPTIFQNEKILTIKGSSKSCPSSPILSHPKFFNSVRNHKLFNEGKHLCMYKVFILSKECYNLESYKFSHH